jgi:hypothetical protein
MNQKQKEQEKDIISQFRDIVNRNLEAGADIFPEVTEVLNKYDAFNPYKYEDKKTK